MGINTLKAGLSISGNDMDVAHGTFFSLSMLQLRSEIDRHAGRVVWK